LILSLRSIKRTFCRKRLSALSVSISRGRSTKFQSGRKHPSAASVLSSALHNPVNRGVLIDARAYVWDVVEMYHTLGGNLSIINTSGDAPSHVDMVANHETAKMLSLICPRMRVFWLADAAKGFDIVATGHIKAMSNPSADFIVKESKGQGYGPKQVLTGWEAISEGIDAHGGSKSDMGPMYNPEILGELKDSSGGRSFPPTPPDDEFSSAASPGGVRLKVGVAYMPAKWEKSGIFRQAADALQGVDGGARRNFSFKGKQYGALKLKLCKGGQSAYRPWLHFDSAQGLLISTDGGKRSLMLELNLKNSRPQVVRVATGEILSSGEGLPTIRIQKVYSPDSVSGTQGEVKAARTVADKGKAKAAISKKAGRAEGGNLLPLGLAAAGAISIFFLMMLWRARKL
jgi:hypothetical protein